MAARRANVEERCMRSNLARIYRWTLMLSMGGTTMSLSTALANIQWGDIVTSFLSFFLSLVVKILLSGGTQGLV